MILLDLDLRGVFSVGDIEVGWVMSYYCIFSIRF